MRSVSSASRSDEAYTLWLRPLTEEDRRRLGESSQKDSWGLFITLNFLKRGSATKKTDGDPRMILYYITDGYLLRGDAFPSFLAGERYSFDAKAS
jgi:hypothetical protein